MKKWVVYSKAEEKVIKNGEEWTLKREFMEFWRRHEALAHHEKLCGLFGEAEIEEIEFTLNNNFKISEG
ncbi:MAG: hypothetical protein ACRCU6_09080 [Fusobacteriaceae bacterium]